MRLLLAMDPTSCGLDEQSLGAEVTSATSKSDSYLEILMSSKFEIRLIGNSDDDFGDVCRFG